MQRASVLSLLNEHRPFDRTEEAALRQILAFVEKYSDCFERECKPGHITGSAWIVDASNQCALLTHHRKLGRWLQPGGHADGDADILRVAWREAKEETGIERLEPVSREIFDVDVHPIPATQDVPAHRHFDIRFAFVAPPGATLRPSSESFSLAWVKLECLDDYSNEESLMRMKRKWLEQNGTSKKLSP